MPVLRATVLVDAPAATVAGVLREVAPMVAAAVGKGHRLAAPRRLLAVGDELRISLRVLPGARLPLVLRVARADGSELRATGPACELSTTLALTPGGTLVTDALAWRTAGGPLGAAAGVVLARRAVLSLLEARVAAVRRRAAELAGARVVVAAAVLRDGRLLAARRCWPAAEAGRWELPGGRVEAGEDEAAALVRECREELGVAVVPGARVGPDLPLGHAGLLRAYAAAELAGPGQPRTVDHSELRWVGAAELAGLDWLEADRALLAELRALLASTG